MRRWGEKDIKTFTPSPYLLNSPIFSSFSGEGHLTSIVTQDRNDGREDNDHDEIDGIGYM